MSTPLVSVVIPCYNHGHFLRQAVNSVKTQSHPNIEIIVVDDGSTDDTALICGTIEGIKYVYQENAGLSSARNTGFSHTSGDYIVFLDADDYLYPDGVAINLDLIRKDPALAFVSGGHNKIDAKGLIIHEQHHGPIDTGHYIQLLQGNYIGMHATVLYTRWVLQEFQFDTSLKACEDYDMYFRITRKYPVKHHPQKIAAYRIHFSNMSSNIPFMHEMALEVQGRQEVNLTTNEEKDAFRKGRIIWTDYYADRLYDNLADNVIRLQYPDEADIRTLEKMSAPMADLLRKKIRRQQLRGRLKKFLPETVKRYLYRKGILKEFVPRISSIDWGDLERPRPFSTSFGYDRGGPVDRYYIEKFLQDNSTLITGRVFEIGDNAYTLRFGGSSVTKSDVLHVYKANDTVTFVGDLTDASDVPSDAFDCIILTQTLHLIYDFRAALRTCHRILKPGGTLLLTVPGITQIDHDEWKEFWLWGFTSTVMKKILAETFPEGEMEIKSFGNVYIATAFLYGTGLPEVRKDLLDRHDPGYQVIIAAKATKRIS